MPCSAWGCLSGGQYRLVFQLNNIQFCFCMPKKKLLLISGVITTCPIDHPIAFALGVGCCAGIVKSWSSSDPLDFLVYTDLLESCPEEHRSICPGTPDGLCQDVGIPGTHIYFYFYNLIRENNCWFAHIVKSLPGVILEQLVVAQVELTFFKFLCTYRFCMHLLICSM